MGTRRRLGEVIVALGYASHDAVESAAEQGRAAGVPLGRVLIDAGVIDAGQLAHALAERNGLDYVDLRSFPVDHGAAALIDVGKAAAYQTVPIAFVGDSTLLVATSNPANLHALDDIMMATGFGVRRAVASPDDIRALIGSLSQLEDSVEELTDQAEEEEGEAGGSQADEAPVVKLVHAVIADAVRRGASDIHFEPRGNDMRVRFRIDGVVLDSTIVPRHLMSGLVSRVKIMADLDIAEKRLPQDGRIGLSVDGTHIDLRVATLPVVRGESVVMRILDKSQVVVDLDKLGMDEHQRGRFEKALTASHGAILVTGPTGSGKTTTLYAGMTAVNTPDKTLITVEDPVEYELEGVKQVQVNKKSGLGFASGLRAMVRADPDVIMVGEVRDGETAQMAIDAALTGHLLLTTLHTNDAPLAAARLIDMGIEPFLAASAIECVVAQRLVRRLCECKKPVELERQVLEDSGFVVAEGFAGHEPGGCMRCGHTGYQGRVGLYEVMLLSEALRDLILHKSSTDELRAVARREGMHTLREDGLEKIRAGMTSVSEVLRVVGTTKD